MLNSWLLRYERNVVLAVALAALLAGCGGGGGGGRNRGDAGGSNAPQPPPVMGDTFAVTTANRLVFFNRSSGGSQSARAITGLMAGDALIGFDIRPANGALIALANSGRLYTINSMTGAASVLSSISPMEALSALTGATGVGVDFNPVADRLRITTNGGKNLRVNVDTGVTTIDGDLTLNGATATGVVGAGYTNKVATACGTRLFYLDVTNNRLLTTVDPNGGTLSVVGNLGVTTTGANTGFEIISAANGSTRAFVVLTVGGAPTVYSLNTMTGAVSSGQPVQGLTSGENIVGISAIPLANVPTAAGELLGLTANNALFSFNSSDPSRLCSGPISITGLAAGENVVGIDVRPVDQNLYGVGVTAGGAGRVFQIDRTTGAISAAQAIVTEGGAAFTLSGSNFGVAFNPAVDLLRVVSDGTSNNNLRIDVSSGVVQNGAMGGDTPIDPATAVLTAAAYTNSFGPARPAMSTLYTIDTKNAALNVQNPANGGTQVRVASLTVPAAMTGASAIPIGPLAAVRGFDINGADDTAFAGLAVGAATNTTLYKINLDSGRSLPLGVIGGGSVRGITLSAVPQATIFGVTADIRLVSFKESSPGTLDINVPITGLANGEDIKGIDVRPANGVIYAYTNQGATYVLDPTTGALSGRVAFTAAQPPLVATPDPFTSTNGLTPGVDFNPVIDRLRLIDDAGAMLSNNLRIDVLNGATITDRKVTVGVKVTAAAYTNSVAPSPAPPGSTALYTIDTASDRLNLQMPAADGVQVDVGALRLADGVRVDATDASGFDIAGSNNFAVAVLATRGSAGIAPRPPTVFTVDLATGTLAPLGAIGLAPGATVTGLALPITQGPATASITATALVDGRSLAQFAVSMPGTVASRAITGLQPGETLVGIDFRPSDGKLYGVSTSNRLYTLDTNTAAATQQGMALTTPLDAMANHFGVDFDPVADLLRIVSDTRQNLRINPATGAGVGMNMGVDAPLMRGDPQPIQTFAAAHTNSFGLPDASRTTQLFVLDAEANSLELQDTSNNAVLVLRGRLSTGMSPVMFTGAGEFDIAGGDNGLALAALQPRGSPQSNLYRIDLWTGLATQVGTTPIGPAGTMPLVALTIVLR